MNAAAPTLGVVGLGSMGRGAALTALARGVPTWGFDLDPAACAKVGAAGGRIAANLAELGAACDVVQLLVVNAAQTEAVLFGDGGIAPNLRRGSVVVASATVETFSLSKLARIAPQEIAKRFDHIVKQVNLSALP